jgi:deaminated glutathione amidase
MSNPFLAAAIQMRSSLNQEKNLQQASALIEQAAAKGAIFIATPEMTTLLDRKPRRLFDALPDGEDQQVIKAFAALAKRLQIHLLLGSAPIVLSREPRKAANRSFLFAPDGTCLARYDKIHMFDVDLPNGEQWKESSIYQPGEQVVNAKTALGMIGLSICYDLRFAQLYRKLAQTGAEILCVPSAFTVPTGKAHWEILLRARAIETGSYVIAPAQGGEHEDGRTTFGHSMIIDPWGEVLAHLDHDQPGFCLAEIDLKTVHETRQQIPSLTCPDMV